MPPPLPKKAMGWTLGPADARIKLGCFLDYTCPFSTKQYKTLRNVVYPKYADKSFSFTMYHQPQPWHAQSTTLHEAGLAVGHIGGTDAFFKFSDVLFEAAQERFYDADVADKSRTELIEELAALAGSTGASSAEEVKALLKRVEVEGQKNTGSSVTQELKFAVKFARQNGIHVSPTTTLNGLVFDSSSSWTLEQWQEVLDPLF